MKKRLLSLVMAMVMAVSVVAIPNNGFVAQTAANNIITESSTHNLSLTRVTNFAAGEYNFRSALGQFMVDTNGGGQGTNVHLWQTVNGHTNQRIRVASLGNGLYSLQASSGRFLDAKGGNTGRGTEIISWTWNNDPNMKWEIYRAADGSHVFVNHRARRVLDVPGGNARNGNKMQLWDWNGTNSQKFWLTLATNTPATVTRYVNVNPGSN